VRVSSLALLAAACSSANTVDLGGDAGRLANLASGASDGGDGILTIGTPVPPVYDCGIPVLPEALTDAEPFWDDGLDGGPLPATVSLPGAGSPATAADGWILFASDLDCMVPHIFAVRADGSRQLQITSGSASDTEPAVSPDGRTVAFTSTRAGTPQIFTIDLATNAVRQLTSMSGGAGQATFSPNGKSIAFVSGFEVYTINAGGGDAHEVLPTSMLMAALNPMMNILGGMSLGGTAEHPVFEPGGDKMIVDVISEIDEIDLATKTIRTVVPNTAVNMVEPTLSRGGADVAFVADGCGASVGANAIEIANTAGAPDDACSGRQGSATNLGALAHPSWGPGTLITFAHLSSALHSRIVVADIAHLDRLAVELVQDDASQQDPTWAPSTFNPR
jgi:Tol biopolymer transport system component